MTLHKGGVKILTNKCSLLKASFPTSYGNRGRGQSIYETVQCVAHELFTLPFEIELTVPITHLCILSLIIPYLLLYNCFLKSNIEYHSEVTCAKSERSIITFLSYQFYSLSGVR